MELTKQLEGASPSTRTKVERYAAYVIEQESTLRTDQVKMRLTPQQKKTLATKAKGAGLSMTDYVVKMCELGE